MWNDQTKKEYDPILRPYSFDISKKRFIWTFRISPRSSYAAVSLGRLICQIEDVRQLLFNGGDAARILAADHVGDLFRQLQRFSR